MAGNLLTIAYTPRNGGEVVTFSVMRDIPEWEPPKGTDLILVEGATPPETRELLQSVAASPEKLTEFLDELAGFENPVIWCWNAAWVKLRETLGLRGAEDEGRWPLPAQTD